MNKLTRILTVAVLTICQLSANAQLLNVKLGSDELVEEAIKGAFVIVESRYCVQDVETNQKYGRGGKSYFNTVDFIGCLTDQGVITTKEAITPWASDKLYDKYRENTKYRPVLDETLIIRSLDVDSTLCTESTSKLTFNSDSTMIRTMANESRNDGLMASSDSNGATNWLVWIKKSSDKESKESIGYELVITKKTIDFSDGQVKIDDYITSSSIMGGVYVSAKVVSVGLVEFSLAGFAVEKSGKWYVEPISADTFSATGTAKDKVAAAPDSDGNDEPDSDLTPVKDKKKKKK